MVKELEKAHITFSKEQMTMKRFLCKEKLSKVHVKRQAWLLLIRHSKRANSFCLFHIPSENQNLIQRNIIVCLCQVLFIHIYQVYNH